MKQCSNCGYNNDVEIDTGARCARCNFDGKLPEGSEVSGNLSEDEPFFIKQTVIVGQLQRAPLPPGEEAATPPPAEKQPEAEVV